MARWLARPRSLWAGFGLSIAVHGAIALVAVAIWLVLRPPMAPIRISTLPNAPSRADVGLGADGAMLDAQAPHR